MSRRKQQHTRPTHQPVATPAAPATGQQAVPAPEAPARDRLAGQLTAGAVSGAARSVTDWIIRQIAEYTD
ncbi:hypothetical protein [Kitasatospora sp. NPDC008115]|uniref:hypothetical protein n=1 Tax=Kitasatospora sp. NPDC008115 TaxID=3364022 RepID=UPI0036E84915